MEDGAVGVPPSPKATIGATVSCTMTAKQQLLERIGRFSEQEAAEALRLLDRGADPVARFFDDAPPDDEPVTAEEEAAIAEANAAIAAGDTIPLEEFLRELAE